MNPTIRALALCAAFLIPGALPAQQVQLTPAERDWLSDHPVIRLGVDPGWTPMEFVDSEGAHSGFTADYLALLNQRLGINIAAVGDTPWAGALEQAKGRELDGLMCVVATPERQAFLSFTDPYMELTLVVFGRDDQPFLPSLASLDRGRVAVIRGYATQSVLAEDYPSLTPYLVDDVVEGLKAVSSGRADYFLGNLVSGSYFAQEKGIANIKVAAVVEASSSLGLSLGVRNDWPELVSILNKGLRSITPDDRRTIYNRWIAVRYETEVSQNWRLAAWVLGIAVAALAVVLLWARQLRRREERFRGLLESTPDAMFIVNRQGEITLANVRAEQIFGYTMQELVGEKIELLVPEEVRDGHPTKRDSYFRDAQVRPKDMMVELAARRRSGEEFPVEISLSVIRGTGGALVCAAVRDITDRQQTQAAVAAAEERSRLLLESVGEGIVGMDAEGRITFLNPAASRLLGYGSDDLLGRPVHETIHHSRPDGSPYPRSECPMYRSCTEGVTVQVDAEVVWRKDGTSLSVDCTAMPVVKDGRAEGAVITIRDITQRQIAEAALAERSAELQRLSEASRAHAEEASSLGQLAARLQGHLAVAEVAQRALDRVAEYLDAPVGALYVLDDDGNLRRCAARALPPEAESWTRFALGSGSIGQVARSRQLSVYSPDVEVTPVTFGFGRLRVQQIVTCPLVSNETLSGVLELCLFSEMDPAQSEWLAKAARIAATSLSIAREAQERAEAEERTRLILDAPVFAPSFGRRFLVG